MFFRHSWLIARNNLAEVSGAFNPIVDIDLVQPTRTKRDTIRFEKQPMTIQLPAHLGGADKKFIRTSRPTLDAFGGGSYFNAPETPIGLVLDLVNQASRGACICNDRRIMTLAAAELFYPFNQVKKSRHIAFKNWQDAEHLIFSDPAFFIETIEGLPGEMALDDVHWGPDLSSHWAIARFADFEFVVHRSLHIEVV